MSARTRIVAVVVLVAALAVVIGALLLRKRPSPRKAVDESYSRFSWCVLGAPLGKDENVGARLRAVERALLGDATEAKLSDRERWPRRCKTEASAFHLALGRLSEGRTSADEHLQQKLYPVVVALDDRSDLGALAALFQLARESGFVATHVPGARSAPEPIRVELGQVEPHPLRFVQETAAQLETPALGIWETDSLFGSLTIRAEARLCADPFTVAPVSCPKISVRRGAFLRAVPSTTPGETWYYDDRYPPSGEPDQGRSLVISSQSGKTRQHSVRKGSVAHALRVEPDVLLALDVKPNKGELLLSLERDGGTRAESVSARYQPRVNSLVQTDEAPYLVGDFVILQSSGEPSPVVLARHIDKNPLALSAPEPVLEARAFLRCAARDGIALVGLAHNPSTVRGIALHDGARWHSHEVEAVGIPTALDCSRGRIVVHGVKEPSSISEIRCSTERCTTKSESLNLGRVLGAVAAAALGEKTLVMWRTDFGDIRMRIGALGELNRTQDRVVFDDGPQPKDTSQSARVVVLIPRGDRTLALIDTSKGRRVPVMIEANGDVRPLPLSRP